MQAQLAQAAVGVDIKKNNAEARKAEKHIPVPVAAAS